LLLSRAWSIAQWQTGSAWSGIYRRSNMLASGRYAMFDDGMGFSLMPWRPVIEQRLGQKIAATVRGGKRRGRLGGSSDNHMIAIRKPYWVKSR
jgi:hypothetical protein